MAKEADRSSARLSRCRSSLESLSRLIGFGRGEKIQDCRLSIWHQSKKRPRSAAQIGKVLLWAPNSSFLPQVRLRLVVTIGVLVLLAAPRWFCRRCYRH